LGLSHSVGERFARLLLEWCDNTGKRSDEGIRVRMLLTHEQIAQLLGTSRETITRLMADFKRHQFIKQRGSSLLVRDKSGLQSLISG